MVCRSLLCIDQSVCLVAHPTESPEELGATEHVSVTEVLLKYW